MSRPTSALRFRVRYSDTDRMGTFSSDRALDWFEHGRTELLREIGLPYAEVEARGVMLPVAEAHVRYLGRAGYDELLELTTTAAMAGRARLRCDARIVRAEDGSPVADGYTVHAFTDPSGKPIRPPRWFLEALAGGA